MPSSSSLRGPRFVTSRPSNTMRPACTGRSPNTVLNTVDLPAPLGPMMVVIAPRAACRLVPFSTVKPPYPATTSSSTRRLSAKVGLDDARVAAHLRGRALGDDAALGEHQDAGAQGHHEFHVVLDDDEGRTVHGVDLPQALAQPREHGGIDAAGGLVEQHQPRPGHERHRDIEQLLLAVAQAPG